MTDEVESDVDARLEMLDNKERGLVMQCRYTSAIRVANEIRRLAKSEGRFEAYVGALFTLMNHASDVLDSQLGMDSSIELIGLLESEEKARSIQPNLNESDYERVIYFYSSCAYDNLAKATAEMHGHNSSGTHQCVTEGIDVCKRTGKTECIKCFHEYASEVYRAADDPEMAIHYAKLGIDNKERGPHDRRWSGAQEMIEILLLKGQLKNAIESVDQFLSFVPLWHSPLRASLMSKLKLTEMAAISGSPNRWKDELTVDAPPEGEFLFYEMRSAQTQAVIDCCEGRFDSATRSLMKWDQTLARNKSVDEWMSNRLYLIAACKMSGEADQAQRLAKPLRKQATESRDWKTLRALKFILDEAKVPAPIPLTAPLDSGPFAPASTEAPAATAEVQSKPETADEQQGPDRNLIPEPIQAIHQRLAAVGQAAAEAEDFDVIADGDSYQRILDDLLATEAPDQDGPDLAQWMLHTISFLQLPNSRAANIWSWGQRPPKEMAGRCDVDQLACQAWLQTEVL